MFEHFEAYITAKASFTKDELKLIRSQSTEKKIRRRQIQLHEGEVCRHKIFVAKGLLRTYCTKDDGTEYTMRFSPENWWTTDHESFSNQTPAKCNIEALEDTDAILWTRESFGALLAAIPTLKSVTDKIMSGVIDASQKRILMHISYTAEEKYQEFVNDFPDVFGRVPLHMVASYLGVSRETLTRIRQTQFKRQL